MPSRTPFFDDDGSLDTDQILVEAEPLAKLIALFLGVALVPFVVSLALGISAAAVVFEIVGQFVLAVGAGLTLMYVIARAIALSNDETAHARVRRVPGEGRTSGRDDASDETDEVVDDANDASDDRDEPSDSSAGPDERTEDSDDSESASDADDSGS